MKRWLRIQTEPIDEARLTASREISRGMGAVVTFLGVVREKEGEGIVSGLDYEAFDAMAGRQFHLLFDDIAQRWPIESVRLIHRKGPVLVNEPSLWVEIVAPHRAEAFAACQHLIDQMKKVVPIWKHPLKE
jgi:molybdopterin synthase catalytic subunit